MSKALEKPLRWGVLAPGGIAKCFVGDLLLPEDADVRADHKVVAVGSRTMAKAEAFVKEVFEGREGLQRDIKCYGDYASLLSDDQVDIVYVASPQSHHFGQAKACLVAGKHVLCEKPLTINAAQTEELVKIAREQKLFFMEARWTKFFPLLQEVRTLVHDKKILGDLVRVNSDFGEAFPNDHRLYDAALGGGCLLDLGIYSLTWISALLWDSPENKRATPRISSSLLMDKTGTVDETTTAILQFDKIKATAVLSASLRVDLHRPGYHTIIQGTKGDLTIHGKHTSKPLAYTLHLKDQPPKKVEPKILGWGMRYEADECALRIAEGAVESPTMDHAESVFAMQVLDTIRKQNNFSFSAEIESLDSGL